MRDYVPPPTTPRFRLLLSKQMCGETLTFAERGEMHAFNMAHPGAHTANLDLADAIRTRAKRGAETERQFCVKVFAECMYLASQRTRAVRTAVAHLQRQARSNPQ